MTEQENNLVFNEMSIEELTETVNEVSKQLLEAKAVLKEKRLTGVRSAIEARRLADSDLADELKKIGVTSSMYSSPFNTSLFRW